MVQSVGRSEANVLLVSILGGMGGAAIALFRNGNMKSVLLAFVVAFLITTVLLLILNMSVTLVPEN